MDTTVTLPASSVPPVPRVDTALVARAKADDPAAIAALFQPFLAADEEILGVEFGGTRGVAGFGTLCFACLTPRRLLTLEIGSFGRVRHAQGALEHATTGTLLAPSPIRNALWQVTATVLALGIFAVAFMGAVNAVQTRAGLPGMALAVLLVALGAGLGLLGAGLVLALAHRVDRRGLVWSFDDGHQVHVHADRARLPRAEHLQRLCTQRRDALAATRIAGSRAAEPAPPERAPWAWIVGAVVVAAIAATVAYRWASGVGAPGTPMVAPEVWPTPPDPAAAPARPAEPSPEQRAAALGDAINAELQRIGFADVSVHVAADGVATVRGKSATVEERDALLQMIAGVDGVHGVRDALEVPKPRPVAAQSSAPAVVAKAPARTVPPVLALPVPRTDPATPAAAPPIAAPAPPPVTPPPERAAARPDAAQVTRDVQRALAGLGLPQIGVQVDESLHVTLRGSLSDAQRKSQAIAAARAATPTGQVRDLIFIVQE
jgi:hypothetical protein